MELEIIKEEKDISFGSDIGSYSTEKLIKEKTDISKKIVSIDNKRCFLLTERNLLEEKLNLINEILTIHKNKILNNIQ